jgi:hypothetical protein
MAFKPKFISFDCYEPALEGSGVSRLNDVRQLPGLLGL